MKPTGPNPQPPPLPAGKTQAAAVPPIQPNPFSPTNAQLAAAQPLSGARPLAIDRHGSVQPTTGTAIPTSNPGVFKPVVQPVPRESHQGPNVVPVGGANTWAPQRQPDVTTQLNALGVRFHKTDILPEGVRFTAIVPSRTDPTASRVFEATAPDQATAIQAVLRQIESQ